jgi:phenylalanyl-tRNA synthetase alpha chain
MRALPASPVFVGPEQAMSDSGQPDLIAALGALEGEALKAFARAHDPAAVEQARVQFLGARQGRLRGLQQQLGRIAKEDRPAVGKRFNEVKNALEAALEKASRRLARPEIKGDAPFDVTLPGRRPRRGRRHPLTQTTDELIDIMGRLGFSVADGPEVEDEWHNFEALNIPVAHPARDPLENFYLATANHAAGDPILLRSQTSTVQIRVMENTPPPVRVISLGRVYRPDTMDATHSFMFHQMEGLYVDRGVTMAHLKTVLRMFAQFYLGHDVHIRFRPSFFPFTEPSVEVDMTWGPGGAEWMELGGAGMVDPHVLESVGYDPEEVTGFAFGLGIERLCMRRHGIDDIRLFYENDVRFLRQF